MATRRRWQSLMVATDTTDRSAAALLSKALQLAERFQADLHVVHVISPTYAFVPDERDQHSKSLDALVARKTRGHPNVNVAKTVVRDYPVADAIVRQVLKHEPDMLIAESHRHGRLSRVLLDQTDWELIRNCPCPLWLSKSVRLRRSMKVLAAVDPFHARDKPARLDSIVLRAALTAAGDRPEHVIACHAYLPPNLIAPAAMPALPAGDMYWPLPEGERRQYEAAIRRNVERRLAPYRIPARNRVTVPGDPVSALAATAKKYDVGLLVMGAISRSALTRFFIGNTAERVIDDVQCDVLVVKPANFRTPVARRVPRPVLGYPAVASAGAAAAD